MTTQFRDVAAARRFEQGFTDADGELRTVFADYEAHGNVRSILHVEADPHLRGAGAAGRFMQTLAEHARLERLKLDPRCAYALAWLKRHREYDDVLA